MSGRSAGKGVQVNVRNVSKRFGSNTILSGLQLHIHQGEFVAVVGRSGCGKSTLLRLIAGLEQPSDGVILLNAEAIKGLQAGTRIMFQDSRLLPWKKVVDNVRIGSLTGDRERAAEALSMVGLASKAGEWPSVLSGGQRQRVTLARALVGEPSLLLLDEPLGALDALTRIEMQRLIEGLWLERRFTVLLVTHDVSEAVALADRVVVMEEGRIGLDVRITLPRPREHDSGFAYFEKLILDRLLTRNNDDKLPATDAATSFSI
ncbi:ATP-binding cassette domain-containing protein [Paenibacillus chartarius]|uniref:ATP-binding cassette domain-containing protein n=1 Tax=Paenibacillus chartarius TaxID=747481 RepID=A0ABV6DTI9_9BACL